jgi:hypothetical protein
MRPLLILVALALTGCAVQSPNYAKAGATAQDQAQQEASCRMEARRMSASRREQDPFIAAGMNARQYQDCMVAAGWQALD